MKTLGQRMEESGNRTSGFDYLRLILSLNVVAWHSVQTSYGTEAGLAAFKEWFGVAGLILMPFFFCLSGFLVTASLLRAKSIWAYLGLRGLRVFPALSVEILLSAFLLGPILTAVDLKAYFSDHAFYTYFLNAVGYPHYKLPGLFLQNPASGIVNNSLWTIPFEVECYIVLFLLAALGVMRHRKVALISFMVLLSGIFAFQFIHVPAVAPMVTGRQLILFFLAGVTLYMWRDKIPHNAMLFAGSLIISILFLKSERLIYLTVFPVAYLTVYLGLLTPKKLPVLFSGDYSYGIYLYGFPIQQAMIALFPQYNFWGGNFFMSLLPVCLFAALSWHFVEKPLLRLKVGLTRTKPIPPITAGNIKWRSWLER